MKTQKEALEFKEFLNGLIPFLNVSVTKIEGFDQELFGIRIDFTSDFHELVFALNGQFMKYKDSTGMDTFEASESEKRILGYVIAYNSACVNLGLINAVEKSKDLFGKILGTSKEGLMSQGERMRLAKNVGLVKGLLEKPRPEDMLSSQEKDYCKMWLKSLTTLTRKTFR
jgi:hypothetical protein